MFLFSSSTISAIAYAHILTELQLLNNFFLKVQLLIPALFIKESFIQVILTILSMGTKTKQDPGKGRQKPQYQKQQLYCVMTDCKDK